MLRYRLYEIDVIVRRTAVYAVLVAASFQPLRTRIRSGVDRRFSRRRSDAERAASLFSSRLRGQIDLDALHGELMGVIDDTVQPAHASLWLREG